MEYSLGPGTQCYEFPIDRSDEQGLILLCCAKIPEMFAAVRSEDEIRTAIDLCLKNALSGNGRHIQVFTNGRLDGPVIGALVKVSQ